MDAISSIFEKLKSGRRLPSPKGVVLRLIELSQHEDASVADVARLVQADPALAGRLVRAANAVGAAPNRPVLAVSDAILRLGLPSVFQLALGFSLVSQYKGGPCKEFDYPGYWSRSLLQAVAARELALRVGLVAPEEAFVCGLLARVGRLALATAWPESYDPAIEADPDAERERFTISSEELTGALLGDWGFPRPLVLAVAIGQALRAAPPDAPTREERLGQLLHVAGRLADLGHADRDHRRHELAETLLSGARLGLCAEVLDRVAEDALDAWRSWCPVFEIDPGLAAFDGLGRAAEAPPPEAGAPVSGARRGMRLLIVDRDAALARQMGGLLIQAGHTVRMAPPDGFLTRLLDEPVDGVLLEWTPKTASACQALRRTAAGRRVHVVALGTDRGEEAAALALEQGADDYLGKPFSPRVLDARLAAHARIVRLQADLDDDIEEMRRFSLELATHNRRLQAATVVDDLTGLMRRDSGLASLQSAAGEADRSGTPLALLFIDIDGLRDVNERHGRLTGDRAVAHVANEVIGTLPAGTAITRFGGDEFLAVIPNCREAAARDWGDRVAARSASNALGVRGSGQIPLTVSVGVALRMPNSGEPSEDVERAYAAAQAAQRHGGNTSVLAGVTVNS
ncbi:hypothetical protein BWI17_17750 [Betaproteobacteria bacterium GR16-43]|nr:hypothetical protein BWI17_17750 [Betaproteobacteria bacterium GR16-43]